MLQAPFLASVPCKASWRADWALVGKILQSVLFHPYCACQFPKKRGTGFHTFCHSHPLLAWNVHDPIPCNAAADPCQNSSWHVYGAGRNAAADAKIQSGPCESCSSPGTVTGAAARLCRDAQPEPRLRGATTESAGAKLCSYLCREICCRTVAAARRKELFIYDNHNQARAPRHYVDDVHQHGAEQSLTAAASLMDITTSYKPAPRVFGGDFRGH